VQLQVRWIGTTPLAMIGDVLAAISGGEPSKIAPHPGGPRGARLWSEAVLEADEPRPIWLPELLRVARERGDDVLAVPLRWRPLQPRLAAFDGDMTLLFGETIDELGQVAGQGATIAAITERAMRGELEFEAALRERVRALAGLSIGDVERVAAAMPWMPGARQLLSALQRRGAKTAVLSGGFHFLLDRRARDAAIDHVLANRLAVRDGRLSGALEGPIVGARAKADTLNRLADELHLAPRQVLAVGDGANDGPMLAAAGIGIAFAPRPALLPSACGVVAMRHLQRAAALLDL
jgi:phosphoserine phosphatase